ncbi:MAG TPA: acetamidase/formamidase family protein [Firmicutes bacterium]|nr:acetamidase/formamidase family protein [Bacillota bacterium]
MKPMGKAVVLFVVLALVLGVVGTGMAEEKGRIIHVSREHKVFAIGESSTPIAKARPGDILVIETEDCFDNQILSEKDVVESIDFNRVNPATGPIYIEGAEPGDTLVVDILSIEVDKQGVMVAIPGLGVLPDEVQTPTTKVLPIAGNRIIWDENFSLPIRPMVGVIGVTPKGDPIPCGSPGDHGGNMDTAEIGAGCRVYLPVNVEGAMLHIGDCHARQADGEVCVSGVECRAVVTARVDVIKNTGQERPVLEKGNRIMFIGSHEDLYTAAQIAVRDAVNYLMAVKKLSFEEALLLASALVEVRISQLVDPLLIVRAEIDLSLLY